MNVPSAKINRNSQNNSPAAKDYKSRSCRPHIGDNNRFIAFKTRVKSAGYRLRFRFKSYRQKSGFLENIRIRINNRFGIRNDQNIVMIKIFFRRLNNFIIKIKLVHRHRHVGFKLPLYRACDFNCFYLWRLYNSDEPFFFRQRAYYIAWFWQPHPFASWIFFFDYIHKLFFFFNFSVFNQSLRYGNFSPKVKIQLAAGRKFKILYGPVGNINPSWHYINISPLRKVCTYIICCRDFLFFRKRGYIVIYY